ncbi:MAG: efflux transporter periplasmic adaptor subunit, partial [Parvibaculum sp.]
DFVSGVISTGGAAAQVGLPTSAIQTVGGETVVFARLEDGFEKRAVEIGRRNGRFAEVLFGVFAGDRVASGNTFVLKAEASRGAAEHSHAH